MIRRIIYLIFTGLLIWYFGVHWHELVDVWNDIMHGKWYWVAAALLCQIAHYSCHTLAIRRSFGALNIQRGKREVLLVSLAALAVNVAAPSLNVSGMAFLVDDAQRRGYPTAGSLLAAGVSVLCDGVVFILFAVIVAFALFIRGGLGHAYLAALIILMALVAFFILLIIFFWRKPHAVRPWLSVFGKKKADEWAGEWLAVTQLSVSFDLIRPVLLCEMAAHFFNFSSLIFSFAAFGIPALGLRPAIAYTVGVLFVILAPTPMGIGFAESGMTVAMVGQGVPLAAASAITLLYRGLAFWIPFVIGAVILHFLRTTHETLEQDHAQSY